LAIVFGSVARGRQTKHSDLDLAVAGIKPLTMDEKMNLIEELGLSTGINIDVLDLQTASGPILQQALCKGVLLLKKDTLLYARLIIKMLYNQADMMPFYNRILKERRERFLHG
jgi:predicted nucleotidyltransferase